ncbi:MAG: serine/threonine protein kinase, partial [Frankia sp.]|nr:serine/threonine protein kinase [Frankia sp.]
GGPPTGTPAYLAPERLRGGPATLVADLFSLGATLLFAADGVAPFARDTVLASLHAVLHVEPVPTRDLGPLAPVIAGLLSKDPAHRLRPDGAAALLTRALRALEPAGPAQPAPHRSFAPTAPPSPPSTPPRAAPPSAASPSAASPSQPPGPAIPPERPASGQLDATPVLLGPGAGAATRPGGGDATNGRGPARGQAGDGDLAEPEARWPGEGRRGGQVPGRWPRGLTLSSPPARLAAVVAVVLVLLVAGVTAVLVGALREERSAAGSVLDRAGAVPAGMVGHWAGTVTQGSARFDVQIELHGGDLDESVGTSTMSNGCVADLLLRETGLDQIIVQEVLIRSDLRCTGVFRLLLHLNDSGTLGYFYDATLAHSAGVATLTRVEPATAAPTATA